jgi:hypothetical protein
MPWRLTALEVIGIVQGRGSVVVAGVTSGLGGGNADHRAKGARSTAAPME